MSTRKRSRAESKNQEKPPSKSNSKRHLSPESPANLPKKPKSNNMSDTQFEQLSQLISTSSNNIETKIREPQSILKNKFTDLAKKVEWRQSKNQSVIFKPKLLATSTT